jgi:hypothetical protein
VASLLDLCRFIPTAGGTADFTYSSTVNGFRSPATAGAINGVSYKYRAESGDLSQWEVGEGIYNSGVLSRIKVIYNSLGTTAKINFTNAPQIALIPLAGELLAFDRKNYIINGAMQVSQEWGGTLNTYPASNGRYPVDMFSVHRNGAGALSHQWIGSPGTVLSSNFRIRITCTTADTVVDSSDWLILRYDFDGFVCSDWNYGYSSAKTMVLRFGCKGPAGTYYVGFRTPSGSHSLIREFIISAGEANTDVIKTLTVPGCSLTAPGLWPVDGNRFMTVDWILSIGSQHHTPIVLDNWSTGNFLATSSQFNFMGTVGNVFELFDVGMYEGTTAPEFIVPDYIETLERCKRYWEIGQEELHYFGVTLGTLYMTYQFMVEKRASPTITFNNWWYYNPGNAATFVNPAINLVEPKQFAFSYSLSLNGTGNGGNWVANARMT